MIAHAAFIGHALLMFQMEVIFVLKLMWRGQALQEALPRALWWRDMGFITFKRFKGLALCGERLNLPYGTELFTDGNLLITLDGKAVCYCTSENAKRHFARNDDGHGLERGKLVAAIIKTLSSRDKNYQTRWDKVWADSICRKYKRVDHENFWVWNHDFYEADINTLQYIAKLIGMKG